jgi:hypothetical protein
MLAAMPGLIVGEQLDRRAAARLVLEIDVPNPDRCRDGRHWDF